MRSYISQIPPLGWVGVLLPVLLVTREVMAAVFHNAIPAVVCNLLRFL
jgi:hypothetical protein